MTFGARTGEIEQSEAAALRYARDAQRVEAKRLKRCVVKEFPKRFAGLCERRLRTLHERGLLLADAGQAIVFWGGVDIRLKYGSEFIDVPALRFRSPSKSSEAKMSDWTSWVLHRSLRAVLGESLYFEKLWARAAGKIARSESAMSGRLSKSAPGLASFGEAQQIKAACPEATERGRGPARI